MPILQSMARQAVLALVALLAAGCAATVVAPAAPADPRAVYLLDHGRHTSLVLTDADARLWRYAYGEWRWYVDFERGPARAMGALLRPSRAALGRAALRGPATMDALQPQIGSPIAAIHTLQSEGEPVDRLLGALDALFEARGEAPHRSIELMLDVVEHPVPYSLGHNSNHVVAQWLELLGFRVRGSPMIGRWTVAAAR